MSAFARLGWRTHFTVASLLLLVVVQPTLALIRSDFPGVAALHPLNALVMFAGCVWIETKLHRLLRVR